MDSPLRLSAALDNMDRSALPTIAAFLLLAGVWHRSEFKRSPLVPREHLEVAGFTAWSNSNGHAKRIQLGPIAPPSETILFERSIGVAGLDDLGGTDDDFGGIPDHVLADLIRQAVRSGDRRDAAIAVHAACRSNHGLIRTSAFISALDLLSLSQRDLEYFRFETNRAHTLRTWRFLSGGQTLPLPPPCDLEELIYALNDVLAGRLGLGATHLRRPARRKLPLNQDSY